MLALPWRKSDDQKLADEMVETEIIRALEVMGNNDPSSKEYKEALVWYERLHEEQLEEKKLKEARRGRIFDTIATFLLAGVTMTSEYWTPITSGWGRSIMKPFRHKDDINFK